MPEMSFFSPASSNPLPLGSAACIHRAAAMVCFGDLVSTQTRPFMPMAVSRCMREPRSGRR